MHRLVCLVFSFVIGVLAANAATWNVRDFGATGDGVTKETVAFRKPRDACAIQGEGQVLVSAGNDLIGSVQLGHDTALRPTADSVITGSPDLADYPLIDLRSEGRLQPGHRALANVEQAALRDIHRTDLAGSLPATENVASEGLAEAVALPGRVTLWNGTDLTGWKLVLKDPAADLATAWDAVGGLLRLHSPIAGYLRTEASYSNYRLHLEWRWPANAAPKSNSGVLVHLHGEDVVWPACIQIQQKIGSAGQLIGMLTDLPGRIVEKGQTRADRLAPVSEKPLGEWNDCDIYAEKNTLEVYINGVRQNRVDNLPVHEGTIGLQLEGSPIEFRNLWLRTL